MLNCHTRRVGRMVMHWFRKPAGENPYRFESCTLRQFIHAKFSLFINTMKIELPKILVSGKFKPSDLQISVSESNRKIDPTIEAQLEPIWEAKKKKADEEGKICYNGISYRLNSIDEKDEKVILDFGTFEYKVRDGLLSIPESFDLPQEYWRKGCFTCASIKTSDDRYIMAELSGKSMNHNRVDLIGGIMETNIGMITGDDVFKSFYNELEEEAGITEDDIKESYLQTIYLTVGNNVAFYFEVILNVSSEELIERFKNNKDADIKSLCVFTREEYLNVLKNHSSLNKQFTVKILRI